MSHISEAESRKIWCIKGIAVLSVIAAHVSSTRITQTIPGGISQLWCMFGTIGVSCFFLLSGYLYHRSDGDSAQFWKKKAVHLIVPWMFCACLTYTVSLLLGVEFSPMGTLKWVLGCGSWYYFVPVLFMLFVLGKGIYGKPAYQWCILALSVISLLVYPFVKDSPVYTSGYFTAYQDITHWMGYFSLGMIFRRTLILNKLDKRALIPAVIIFLVVTSRIFRTFVETRAPSCNHQMIFPDSPSQNDRIASSSHRRLRRHDLDRAALGRYTPKATGGPIP